MKKRKKAKKAKKTENRKKEDQREGMAGPRTHLSGSGKNVLIIQKYIFKNLNMISQGFIILRPEIDEP